MDATGYVRLDLQWGHELIEQMMADVTPEQLTWAPPGTANPLGATYAHAVCGEDGVVQQVLRGQPMLFDSSWKGRTGISEPRFHSEFEWARGVTLDLPTTREYAQAVYRNTDDYLAGLEPSELDRELDLTGQGMGVQTIGWAISVFLASHMHNMIGEISVLRGLQGQQGYPW